MSNNSKLNFSKSKYFSYCQCPKKQWLAEYRPELLPEEEAANPRLEAGIKIGNLAKGLFGEYVEVTTYNNDKLDLAAMLQRTKDEMAKGTAVICEAAFSCEGLYSAVDILKKDGDGWTIYEVKSSTKAKPFYDIDVAYQKYVLEKSGVKVNGTYLVHINNQYIFDGTIDIQQLFAIKDVSESVEEEYKKIETVLKDAAQVMTSETEPDVKIGKHCEYPYECPYFEYCTRALPKPSVFDLYNIAFNKALKLHNDKLDSFEDLLASNSIENEKQIRQMEYALEDKGTYINREGIRDFLKKLSYPLYFLDFESVQPAIPEYIGTRPYMQIPFQYSLHYIEKEGGPLLHKEFLGVSGEDPRRAIAESLCRDIPMGVCVTAYNKGFECGRLNELASEFPDLGKHLENISKNIVDLLDPFQGGFYYNRAMGNSFSIKSVLPAIFPSDPELDYHNLDGVHNGSEAMDIFPKIKDMSPEEQLTARNNLLKYCELDTYAMVKLWEELVRVSMG